MDSSMIGKIEKGAMLRSLTASTSGSSRYTSTATTMLTPLHITRETGPATVAFLVPVVFVVTL